MNDILRRLYGLGCTFEPSTVFGGTSAGAAVTRHIHSGRCRSDVSTRSWPGSPGRSDTSLGAAVERSGARLLVAGDAVAPRTALHAFREGDDAGRAA